MARKISIQKAYEDVEIDGKVFRVDLSDDKIKEYDVFYRKYLTAAEEFQNIKPEDLSEVEMKDYMGKAERLLRELVNIILNDDRAYDHVYEACGRSTLIVYDVIDQVYEVIEDKQAAIENRKREYYMKKFNKNKRNNKRK